MWKSRQIVIYFNCPIVTSYIRINIKIIASCIAKSMLLFIMFYLSYQYNALVICKTHLLTPGNGASWLRHVPQNRDAQYRHGRKMSVTILTLMCVIVSHFTTLRHLVCQWDRLFLQAEVFLKCASLASHFHEMVCHMFDSNVRRWNVMVCHFL